MTTDSTPLQETQGLLTSYKTYKYRFLISAIYLFSCSINSLGWVSCNPLLEDFQKHYNAGDLDGVTFKASTVYLIIFIPMSFIANFILDKLGIRIGIMMGCILTITGLWIKTLANNPDAFDFIFIGQALGAFGAPLIINTPQKISAVWYPPEERGLSTTILSIAAPLGVGVGFMLTPLGVGKVLPGQDGINQFVALFRGIAIVGSIFLGPAIILMREKPPTAPSKAAEAPKSSFKDSMLGLLKNKNYLVFLFGVSCMWGTYGTLATVMGPLIGPFNYDSSAAGYFGGIVLVMGLIGSPIWGNYVGKTRKYRMSLLILGVCSTTVLGSLLLIGPYGNFAPTAVGIALYGFFTTPMLPIIFEFTSELTFPVNETTSGGVTYAMTQLVAFGGAQVLTKLLSVPKNPDGSEPPKNVTGAKQGFVILICFQIVGLIGFFFTKEDLKRTKFEKGEVDAEISGYGAADIQDVTA